MAALVTGLIPILRTAVDATTTYKCRFLSIRLVILFLAQLPFTKLDADFTCNGTRDNICTKACFNEQFQKPMLIAWNFIFLLVVISVLLMELFTSHLRSTALRKSSPMKADVELEGQVVAEDPRGKTFLDLHKDRGTVGVYLLSIALRILIEAWFVYVLLYWNLPALSDASYKCKAKICPQLLVCVVRAAPEKHMSIYALTSISGMIIVSSVVFCMYAIAHYLCNF